MTTTAPNGSCAERTLASLTRAQKIGQLLMVGLPAAASDGWLATVGSLPVGGVFVAGRWTAGSSALKADIASVQQRAAALSGVTLHVAVDQEGGFVQSLRGSGFPAIPSAVEQGQESTSTLARATASWASLLVEAGITLDLAPVADVVLAGTAAQNPPIGQQDRQYGSTPDAVSASVVTVVRAMLGVNLGSTVKHFPGLGRVRFNTDTSTGAVDDETTATDDSLQPFRDAIAAGTTAVMISSARYPQLDPDDIAAFSEPIITGLLRQTLGFTGLVISDDLGQAAAVSSVPAGRRAVDFIAAGGDMALTVQAGDLAAMTTALASQADASSTFRARVDDAALHVLQSKERLGMSTCS